MKSKTTALILSILVGGLGVDRFYLGYTGMGILKLLTGGVFGIMWLIDLINIACGNLKPADGSDYQEAANNYNRPNTSSSVYDDLNKINELHKQGVINDEEFDKMKKDLLGKI